MIKSDDLYWYVGKVKRVIDGDTLVVDIQLGFGVSYNETVRLAGIDAYEKTLRGGTTPEEKVMGIEATEFLTKLLTGKEVLLKTFKDKGKYGRFVAGVFLREDERHTFDYSQESSQLIDICKMMVDKGYAVYKEY